MNCEILSNEINSKFILINGVKLQVYEDGRIFKFNKKGDLLLVPNIANDNGYNRLTFNYIKTYRHRIIAFTFLNLDINNVKEMVDHINHDTLNNCVSNLRVVTNQHNLWNRTAKGYTFDKLHNKWIAQIKFNKKIKYLGSFNTEAEAAAAYQSAKLIYHQIQEIKKY